MKAILILLVLVTTASCSLHELVIGEFPTEWPTTGGGDTTLIDTAIVDTIPSGIIDSCINLVVIDTPKFVTVYNEFFNGLPTTNEWYFHWGQNNDQVFSSLTELLAMLKLFGVIEYDSVEYYEEGNSAAAIIVGLGDKSKIENRVWRRDAIDQKAIFVTNIQGFIFGGALTYEEYLSVAQRYQSVATFNFRNTNWIQEQYETVALAILGECKMGRRIADFRFNVFPISDELYCLFVERKWETVLGQVLNCVPPQSILKYNKA